MKKSALIVSIIASVIWLVPIGGVIGILFGIGGIILSQEAFQERKTLCLVLSIFGLGMSVLIVVTWFVPMYILYGIT